MSQRITMVDIAREAGVSVMTVSRAINNKDGISDTTRQRIMEIVERLSFRPSDIARSLVTDRTATLGLVVPDNANPFFSEVARGVEQVAYAEGYNVFLCNTDEDAHRELAILRSLEEKRVDGVILCSPRLSDEELVIALSRYPNTVLMNRKLGVDRIGTVQIDDVMGGRIATEHLIARGHRNIGFIAGPETSYSGRMRTIGHYAALEDAGITRKPEWRRRCLPMVETGKQTVIELLTATSELTALFCHNDLVAVGALQACAELRIRVPDDIAIVGFDDIYVAPLVMPSLTTCRVAKVELGAQATRLLLDYINGCDGECTDIILQPELIIRDSAP